MAKKFPDLNKDGKVTQADVLKGRGVFKDGNEVDVEENQKEYIRSLLESQMISKMPNETQAEATARQERIQQELDIEQETNESLFMEVIKEDRKPKAKGSLMVPPEREQANRGLKVIAKKLLTGAKKIDKKLESKLDEMQGLDDTVIGVSSKTGRPKFATPGETAPEKGAIVGKERVKIRDTSKTTKGGIYGALGTAGAAGTAIGVAALLELFDGNETAMISYAEANTDLPSSSEASDFEKAFSAAFKAGEDTFEFKGKTYTTELKRDEKADGGAMAIMMPEEYEEPPKDTYNNISSEEDKEQVENMNSDGEMEEEYLDYVADEVLSQDEQDYLFKALDEDNKLEEILDKVMLNATEFTGAGEINGPGTGVSDSIPARLSDGEFVFTKKATDQIGSDKLQTMMDDAEREFDSRSGKAEGGMPVEGMERYDMEKDDEDTLNRQMAYSNRMPSLMNR
tara:strand:+ start:1429 stop:2793 length:1365 start_codon:yes stop_codon:yes gene_type:complete